MQSVTTVVLTGFKDIFDQFRTHFLRYESAARVVVVRSRGVVLDVPAHWEVVDGIEPFVFARNANIGIRTANSDDVLLINDDVSLRQENTLKDLSAIAHSIPQIGVLSPQFLGGVGNPLQRNDANTPELCFSKDRLCFTAVFLKRAALDAVGLLDESFTEYGSEDDDWCFRAQSSGFLLAITRLVSMRHGFGKMNATASFARTVGRVAPGAARMRRRFEAKHGLGVGGNLPDRPFSALPVARTHFAANRPTVTPAHSKATTL